MRECSHDEEMLFGKVVKCGGFVKEMLLTLSMMFEVACD